MKTDHHGYFPVQGGELYYETAGHGPAVVLIHAGVADLRMWQPQMAVFAEHYYTICFDSRGYGRSRTQSVPFSNRLDLLALLDALQVEQAVLVGNSRGGQVAIDFTLEYPARVAGLIPVAAGLSGYEHHPSDSPKAQAEVAAFAQMENLWEQKDFEQLADLEVQIWGDGLLQPAGRMELAARQLLSHMIRQNYQHQDGEAIPQPLQPPAINRLDEIHCPALVLHGDLDSSAIETIAILLEQKIPKAQRILYPGVAHMVSMEAPERFNYDVLAFLAQIYPRQEV